MKNILTPIGVSDFTPDEATHYYKLTHTVSSVYEQAGYRVVRTGSIEYYDAIAHALPGCLQTQVLKFFDADGRTLVLRPDHTTVIARLVASRLQQAPLPLKLYYQAPVFRSPLSSSTTYLEHMQSGVEHIGTPAPHADAEILSLCANGLTQCGITDIGFEIGHCDFRTQFGEEAYSHVVNGNFAALGRMPQIYPLADMPADNPLTPITDQLPNWLRDKIMINMALTEGTCQYTGMIFRCYVKGHRTPVASGGRYDQLLAKFGYAQPAVGFAFDLAVLQQILETQ